MFEVSKQISFEAGHRLMNYDGKCKWLHGHNYVMTLYMSSKKLDDRGMVVDFADVKAIAKDYIDKMIDHGMILCVDDEFWIETLREKGQKVYLLKENPTAEALAKHFYYVFKLEIPEVVGVRITETPTSEATYYGGEDYES